MASLKLFRCTNPRCRVKKQPFEFTSEDHEPSCPKCMISSTHPRFRVIQRMVMVHFDPPAEVPGYGTGFRACDPEAPIAAAGGPDGTSEDWEPNPFHGGTADPGSVTCPACKATAAWREAAQREESSYAATITRLGQHMVVR